MQEKENIRRILKETAIALKKTDGFKLKILSDQTNHSATIYQDPDNIIVAVLVYALGKITERENYKKMKGWNTFIKNISANLNKLVKAIDKNNLEEFRNLLGEMRDSINKIEGNLKDYISDVFYKAEINRAFKLYEHGLSSQKTAQLLGISLWDLSSYIGQSTISEAKLSEPMPVKKRVEIMESFLK
jgi:hypothetical protein